MQSAYLTVNGIHYPNFENAYDFAVRMRNFNTFKSLKFRNKEITIEELERMINEYWDVVKLVNNLVAIKASHNTVYGLIENLCNDLSISESWIFSNSNFKFMPSKASL